MGGPRWSWTISYPKSEDSWKYVTVSVSVYLYNAQSKGMVKSALKAEGYTSWVINSIESF